MLLSAAARAPVGFAQRLRASLSVNALVLLALYLAYVASYRYVVLVPDTARDLVQGMLIAQRQQFPAAGPLIADRWVLSPLWFYLVAALQLLSSSVVTLSLLVGAIAGLKIPLAHALARRVLDARYALLFAVLVALPSWTVLEHLVWSHTNLVQVSALAACLALWRVHEKPGDLRWFVALLALALATQAHPTNLVLVAPLALLLRSRTLRPGWRGALAGTLAGLALALPSLLHELPRTALDIAAGDAQAFAWSNLAAVPALLAKLALRPYEVLEFLLAQYRPWLAGVVVAFSYLLLALAAPGLLLALVRRERLACGLLAWLLLAVAFVAALRPWTPAYMVFAPGLVALALLARGVHATLALLPLRLAQAGQALIVLGVFGGWIAFLAERSDSAERGEQHLPRMALIDVRKPAERTEPANVLFPVTAQRRAMRAWCRGETDAGVAGDLAAMLLMTQAAPWQLARCPPAQWPRLSAHAGALAGYSRPLARELGLPDDRRLGPYVLTPVRRAVAVAPEERLRLLTRYPPYSLRAEPAQALETSVQLAAGELLVVTNLLEFFNPASEAVSIDGAPLAPLAASENSRFYACPSASGACTLHLALRAQRLRWTPVYVIARPRAGDETNAACDGPCAGERGRAAAADNMTAR